MLGNQYRLKRKRDFEILFTEGRFFRAPIVDMKIWQVSPEKYPKRGYTPEDLKIGFIIGVKVSKSAVKRNRVKRQMREVVRLLLLRGGLKRGYFVAFLTKPPMLVASYKEIEQQMFFLLKQAKILL